MHRHGPSTGLHPTGPAKRGGLHPCQSLRPADASVAVSRVGASTGQAAAQLNAWARGSSSPSPWQLCERPPWAWAAAASPSPGSPPGARLLLEKNLIRLITGEFTLNFVVDRRHRAGGRSLVCRETSSFGHTGILFQSGSSKKAAMQRACACVCAELPQKPNPWVCIVNYW